MRRLLRAKDRMDAAVDRRGAGDGNRPALAKASGRWKGRQLRVPRAGAQQGRRRAAQQHGAGGAVRADGTGRPSAPHRLLEVCPLRATEAAVFRISTRFNPRPRASDDARWRALRSRQRGFNPRSRASDDDGRDYGLCHIGVSIHARARATTAGEGAGHRDADVSIHARARATTVVAPSCRLPFEVSIHARARATTLRDVQQIIREEEGR